MTISTFFLGQVSALEEGAGPRITSITSEMAGHEKKFMVDWKRPRQYWEATDNQTEQIIVIDLGATFPDKYVGIYLRGLNFEDITIESNSAANAWANPETSSEVEVKRDVLVARRQGAFFFEADRSPITRRYIRLRIGVVPGTDDGGNYRIGVLTLIRRPTEVDVRAAIGLTVQAPRIVSESGIGHADVTNVGERILTMQLPWDWLWDQQLGADINEEDTMMALSPNNDVPLVVCRDVERPDRAYLVRRVGDIQINSSGGVGASMPLAYTEVG